MKLLLITSVLLFATIAEAQTKEVLRGSSASGALSTNIDFNSTLIQSQMKAPTGFFIKGRKKSHLQQLVKLRTNFRKKLISSKYAVDAVGK